MAEIIATVVTRLVTRGNFFVKFLCPHDAVFGRAWQSIRPDRHDGRLFDTGRQVAGRWETANIEPLEQRGLPGMGTLPVTAWMAAGKSISFTVVSKDATNKEPGKPALQLDRNAR